MLKGPIGGPWYSILKPWCPSTKLQKITSDPCTFRGSVPSPQDWSKMSCTLRHRVVAWREGNKIHNGSFTSNRLDPDSYSYFLLNGLDSVQNHCRLWNNNSYLTIFLSVTTLCCGQLWVRHIICGQTCDGLYHFAFYLIILGLYSEIDHIHLSSESQCVSHHLPQVDCHTLHSSF